MTRVFRKVAATAAMAVALAVLAAGLCVRMSGARLLAVQTGSMGRTAPIGSLVVGEPTTSDTLHVGEIVIFHPPAPWREPGGAPVVHRIWSITTSHGKLAVQTKGDANKAPDPWTLDAAGTSFYRAAQILPSWVSEALPWTRSQVAIPILAGIILVWYALARLLPPTREKGPRSLRVTGRPA